MPLLLRSDLATSDEHLLGCTEAVASSSPGNTQPMPPREPLERPAAAGKAVEEGAAPMEEGGRDPPCQAVLMVDRRYLRKAVEGSSLFQAHKVWNDERTSED